jgi:hypothetical protein
MPYCPKCGKEVLATDQFCLNCGQSLERLSSHVESPSPPDAQLVPAVPAMDTSNLYLIGDEGILKIGTMFPLVAVSIILGAAVGLLVQIFTDFGNWVAISVVLTLLVAPIICAFRARRLSTLTSLSHQELSMKQGVRTIPWSSIQSMRIKGKRLSFRTVSGWFSATIDRADASRLGQKAASMLGGNFAEVSEDPPRFSPITKFFLLTAAIFILTEGITIAASLTPFFAGEQGRYTSFYNNVESGLGTTLYQQWITIFLNNVEVALTSFVPAYGSIILGFASYNTGRIVQVIAIHYSTTLHYNVSPSAILVALYILPHSWVEEVSYPLAGALGFYMFTWRHQSYAEFSSWKTRASTKVAMGFVFIALILAFAALLEVVEGALQIGALLLWVPVVLGSIYAYLRFKPQLAAYLS